MTRWLDTFPPLDRELGFYLLLASFAVYALARLVQGACHAEQGGRDHGPL
ncbi:hypothetical protein FG93_05524 [Bosea sp. LC85]|nr:hypothetical protein [Bosea sp. LC85]KFC64014.1 hypothetical protein FG93_05524 [Bosea sp. LC85]